VAHYDRNLNQTSALGVQRVAWQLTLFMGFVTLVLGIIVAAHPSTSLNVIAVLVGIIFLASGVFELIRALDTSTGHRGWTAVVGLAFVVIGVVLIRHLHVTRVLIALLIGLIWIVQGVAELMIGVTETDRRGRGWSIVFGTISLIAGIVVVAWPSPSIVTLAVLLGIWFIVLGILQILGALTMRHIAKQVEQGNHAA
jgi:uncharacterized membrane protein HdeD (DUF308 family)